MTTSFFVCVGKFFRKPWRTAGWSVCGLARPAVVGHRELGVARMVQYRLLSRDAYAVVPFFLLLVVVDSVWSISVRWEFKGFRFRLGGLLSGVCGPGYLSGWKKSETCLGFSWVVRIYRFECIQITCLKSMSKSRTNSKKGLFFFRQQSYLWNAFWIFYKLHLPLYKEFRIFYQEYFIFI